ncbi:glycosyltransferase family 2 protein [bacterium]|nr:glycosyltransferase family 2 protein [bacterium]
MKRAAYVMVNHNGGEETLASARSLLADLTVEDVLILVDNGSTDGSGELVAKELKRLVYLHHSENLPFAAATNVGIRKAMEMGAEVIGLINPDVRILPGMTNSLLHHLQVSSSASRSAVSPVMLYDEPKDRIWYAGGRIYWSLGWLSHRGAGRHLSRAHRYGGETDYLTGCCWLASIEVWERVGLLDESYGMYAEDADWSVRAKQQGVKLLVDPTALLVHRLSLSTGGGRNPLKMMYRTRATRLFLHRFTPGPYRVLQKPLSWLVAQAYTVFLLLRHGKASASAYHKAWQTSIEERIPWPPSRPTNVN